MEKRNWTLLFCHLGFRVQGNRIKNKHSDLHCTSSWFEVKALVKQVEHDSGLKVADYVVLVEDKVRGYFKV